MMTSSPTNQQPSQVRFRGPDDDSIRSAWSTTNRSIKPPSPAERKPTIGPEGLDQAKRDALAVAKDHSFGSGSKSIFSKPSALKHRAQTVPILKVGLGYSSHSNNNNEKAAKPTPSPDTSTELNETDTFDINAELFSSRTSDSQNLERQDSRSAWTNHEARHSVTSVRGPTPARRQKTLDEFDLREAAMITAMEDSLESTTRDNSAKYPRDARW